MTKFEFSLVAALLAVTGFAAYDVSAKSAEQEANFRANWGGEGILMESPEGGPNFQITDLVEPGVMSIVFSDERVARDLYEEARGNGERVCLADLGPQSPEFRGQRWWLFSC